jgi:hypothetical protein
MPEEDARHRGNNHLKPKLRDKAPALHRFAAAASNLFANRG